MENKKPTENMNALRRDIKRAKLFAIQHLTRRVKMLKNKRGTAQQLEKNTRKAARFEDELEHIKELNIDEVIIKIKDKDLDVSAMDDDIKERAIARLLSSKPIQDYLSKQSQSNNSHKRQKCNNPKECLSQTELDESEITRKTKEIEPEEENPNSSPLQSYSASDNDSSLSENEEITLQRTPTSFFVESLSSVKDHNTTKQAKNTRQKKEKTSSSESRIAMKTQKERKKSSNRMGQRARQRLWKEQYGKKANHFKSNDKNTNPKQDRKKAERKTSTKGNKRKDNSVDETLNHPSWEASKRRKMQQNISKTKFQGQKITFDDSD
ncbi:serum response factor-binding protein 1-like isoform X2 [Dendronephthya gigantea]|nr:serum response factor-binding protein 1-like isoform X2 [Dendronephthya gigantea]